MTARAEFFIEGQELLPTPYHYTASGLDNVFLLNGVSERATDYGPMVHVENINALHHAIGLHIVEQPEPMDGAEFRFLRKQLQLSQAELGTYMGVTDQTIANYEKGKSGKDGIGPADAYMRALYLLRILPEQTRVDAIKSMIDVPVQNARPKLPEAPRQKIVGRWREGGPGKIAA